MKWALALFLLPLSVWVFPVWALSDEASILGNWCTLEGRGETIFYIEADALGVHEHTMCDWHEPPGGPALTTLIDCRNIHFEGDRVIETPRQTYTFIAALQSDDTLLVQVENEPQARYHRCDY
ncbi:hypothetical protein E2K80_09380 [Rhodophyticola sp. CCM32]|uniref:hypothetical protein n=1 Tax=Rhodophyticola sp. CCM32 TaxID=2916397 RepID=UPI00107FD284|nr:hypothetical protein [Rhodophyticola sp. CCM32]QBY00909.1 hypothetical protein E2K80_09380 [Rhodophyticola sp. CCM32]